MTMSTRSLTLSVPSALARELESLNRDFLVEILRRGLRQWRVEKALERYAAGEMSFGAAASQAGLSQPELARQAYARGIEPLFSNRLWQKSCREQQRRLRPGQCRPSDGSRQAQPT